MAVYEEIVNCIEACKGNLEQLIEELCNVDSSGQFLCSAARFLAAVDRENYAEYLPKLVECAIDKDRERRYIGQLLKAIWGVDYESKAMELCSSDNLFRRIYKRVFPAGIFD